MSNQIKSSESEENVQIKLDDFKRNGKKKNLRGDFREQSDELPNIILSVYRYNINCVNVPCNYYYIFFFFRC